MTIEGTADPALLLGPVPCDGCEFAERCRSEISRVRCPSRHLRRARLNAYGAPVNSPLGTHPAAELFPLLSGADYDSFKADIAARGLIEAIWLCDGKILDGRNRYRACAELGIEVRTRDYTGDSPVAFVWSLNGTRRQLSKSQLAAIAATMLPALEAEAKKRQGKRNDLNIPPKVEEGLTRDEKGHFVATGEAAAQAAKIVGISASYVHEAKRVKKDAPELFEQVKAGKLTVDRARRTPSPISGKPVTRELLCERHRNLARAARSIGCGSSRAGIRDAKKSPAEAGG